MTASDAWISMYVWSSGRAKQLRLRRTAICSPLGWEHLSGSHRRSYVRCVRSQHSVPDHSSAHPPTQRSVL